MLTKQEEKRLDREHRRHRNLFIGMLVALAIAAAGAAYILSQPVTPKPDIVTLDEDQSYTFKNTSLLAGGYYLRYVKWSENRLVFRYLSNDDRNVFHVAAKPGTSFTVNHHRVEVESVKDVIHTIRLRITPIDPSN